MMMRKRSTRLRNLRKPEPGETVCACCEHNVYDHRVMHCEYPGCDAGYHTYCLPRGQRLSMVESTKRWLVAPGSPYKDLQWYCPVHPDARLDAQWQELEGRHRAALGIDASRPWFETLLRGMTGVDCEGRAIDDCGVVNFVLNVYGLDDAMPLAVRENLENYLAVADATAGQDGKRRKFHSIVKRTVEWMVAAQYAISADGAPVPMDQAAAPAGEDHQDAESPAVVDVQADPSTRSEEDVSAEAALAIDLPPPVLMEIENDIPLDQIYERREAVLHAGDAAVARLVSESPDADVPLDAIYEARQRAIAAVLSPPQAPVARQRRDWFFAFSPGTLAEWKRNSGECVIGGSLKAAHWEEVEPGDRLVLYVTIRRVFVGRCTVAGSPMEFDPAVASKIYSDDRYNGWIMHVRDTRLFQSPRTLKSQVRARPKGSILGNYILGNNGLFEDRWKFCERLAKEQ